VDAKGDGIFDEVYCTFDEGGGAPVDVEADADDRGCGCFEGVEGFPRLNLMPKPFPRGVL
jgi:hypothetical protein